MPNRVTKEVVGGIVVVRYNGNNSTGSGSASREESRRFYITAAQKAKAGKRSKEARYAWRYLGGP